MSDLAYVLRHLPKTDDPNLLVGSDPADDAAVYRVNDDLALVQTVDFFTPIVDDPRTYGQIAVANSLSDVYAVGGTPLTALNVVAFPVNDLPRDVLAEILRGGEEKAREAGVTIVGGHTIDDSEPKYGLSVLGTVRPEQLVTQRGAQPGDALILTKPIGTGTIGTAIKAGVATAEDVRQAVLWMTTLNRQAAAAMVDAGVSAATDVTGFGLLGHLSEMARASQVGATVSTGAVPLLPGALNYVREGQIPGGTHTNLEALSRLLGTGDGVDEERLQILADPQTSGGLLISMPVDRVPAFRSALAPDGLAAVIGHTTEGDPGTILVEQ